MDGVSKAGEERMKGVDGVSEDGRRRRREGGWRGDDGKERVAVVCVLGFVFSNGLCGVSLLPCCGWE